MDNALRDTDFDEEFDLTAASSRAEADPAPEATPPPDDAHETPANDTTPDDFASDPGGARLIPAISILAFSETDNVHEVLQSLAADRRMARATMEIVPGGLDAAVSYLAEHPTPNLLILESTASGTDLVGQIDRLAEHCEDGVEVMVIGAVNDIRLYRQLMARGVSEYIVPPVQPLQLYGSISDLFTDPSQPFLGKSIAVIGAKGGVGASTIAHNLAWSMAENCGLNTTLVDLDLSFGTTALDFNHDPQSTVLDALLDPERADDAVVERLIAKTTEKLSLFSAPATVANMPEVDPGAYAHVIETVRHNVPYVVLDLPHLWSSWVRDTLVAADEIVIVCQPDLASLRNGKNLLDQLVAERANDAPPRVILNMAGVPKRPEIPVNDFAAAMGTTPEEVIAFEPQLFGIASNNGQMLSEADPASKASQALDRLASILTGQHAEPRSKSLLQKLLGK